MFERLHLEERRRKEKEAASAATTKSKDLEECTFAPSVSSRDSAPTERDTLPVHERLLQDAARHKEKMLQLEASQAKLLMEQTTFSPLIPESSRRLAGDSEDRNIFERLTQRKPAVTESPSTPSRHGSISERSLYRSKSVGRERNSSNASLVPDEPLVLTKKPLTPEEQNALYGRLSERAKSAAEKLRELRSDPDAGRESMVSPLRTSSLGSFSDRSLSRPKNRALAAEADKPSVLTKAALTPEEQEALYNRLNERAKSASEKLRELREHPEIIAETAAAAVRSSSYANFEDRSLFRSKSVGRAQSSAFRSSSNPDSKPLTAEEQDALYNRLIERAREASEKLKDVRSSVPREGASYNVEVPRTPVVRAVDQEKQGFYDRLATPKKAIETEPVYSSVPDRSLTGVRDSSSGKAMTAKERPKSFIPVRSGSIRVTQPVSEHKHISDEGKSGTTIEPDASSQNADAGQANGVEIPSFADSLNFHQIGIDSSSGATSEEVSNPVAPRNSDVAPIGPSGQVDDVLISNASEPQENDIARSSLANQVEVADEFDAQGNSIASLGLASETEVESQEDSFSSPDKSLPPAEHTVESSAIKPMTPFSPATGLSVDVENTPSDTLVVSDTGEVHLSPKSALLRAGMKSTPGGVFY